MAERPGPHQPQDAKGGLQQLLREYRLDHHVKSPPKPPPAPGDVHFDPERDDVKQYYVRVPVASIADLKMWIGARPAATEARPAEPHAPPDASRAGQRTVEGLAGPLDDATREAAERQLLFGDTDDRMLSDPFWSGIAARLLDRYREITVLVLPDLVVPDGTTTRISNTPTAMFNRVTVYGSGSIHVLSDCKLICDSFEVLPAPTTPGGTGPTTTNQRGQ